MAGSGFGWIRGTVGGGIGIQPYLQEDGFKNPASNFVYDSLNYDDAIAGREMLSSDEMHVYHNYFNSPDAVDVSNLWGVDIVNDYSTIIGDPTYDDGLSIFPQNLNYQATQIIPLNPNYYEQGKWVGSDAGFSFGAEKYHWTDENTGINDVNSGNYTGVYGRVGLSNYTYDVYNDGGLSRIRRKGTDGGRTELWMSNAITRLVRVNQTGVGGEDQWGLNDRGAFINSPSTRPAYYQNNPSSENLANLLDHVPNTRYVHDFVTPYVLPNNFKNTFSPNTIYNKSDISSGTHRMDMFFSYDAVFFVTPTGNNSGAIGLSKRKNNKYLPYQSIQTAWLRAYQHSLATGDKTLVHADGVFANQSVSAWYGGVDLYLDYGTVIYANKSGSPVFFQFSGNPSTVNNRSFSILGHGSLFNTNRQFAGGINSNGFLNFRCGLGTVSMQRGYSQVELRFLDGHYHQSGFGGTTNFDCEFRIKEIWGRDWTAAGGGTVSGRFYMNDCGFPNGLVVPYYRGTISTDWSFIYDKNIFHAPDSGTTMEIRDRDNNLVFTMVEYDFLDTSLFANKQDLVNGIETWNSTTGISACVEQLVGTNFNNDRTTRGTKHRFVDCEYLINKINAMAFIIIQGYDYAGFDNYSDKSANLIIDGGYVHDSSGQNGEIMFVVTRFNNNYNTLLIDNLEYWNGHKYGTKKYIDTFTVLPAWDYLSRTGIGFLPVASSPELTYAPLKNMAGSKSWYVEKEEVLDISGVTDGVWSIVNTDFRFATLEVLIEPTGGGFPNIDVYLRKIPETETSETLTTLRGANLKLHSRLNMTVQTDAYGDFEINTSDKANSQLKIISVTTERGKEY